MSAALPAVKAGDRIRLDSMTNDPCPIEAGSTGTVRSVVDAFHDGSLQIGVDWDSGRTLSLVTPPDRFTVIERPAA